jgi:hypothetical protein
MPDDSPAFSFNVLALFFEGEGYPLNPFFIYVEGALSDFACVDGSVYPALPLWKPRGEGIASGDSLFSPDHLRDFA